MRCSFEISTDPARSLLTVRMSGFIDMDTVARWRDEREAAIARLGLPANAHLSLYDATDMTIQSQEVMAAFQAVVEDRRLASRRLAFVLGPSAFGMQIRRIVKSRESVACFDDIASAETWLLQPAEDGQPLFRDVA